MTYCRDLQPHDLRIAAIMEAYRTQISPVTFMLNVQICDKLKELHYVLIGLIIQSAGY